MELSDGAMARSWREVIGGGGRPRSESGHGTEGLARGAASGPRFETSAQREEHAPGEHHSIPSAMFGDMLRGRGYHVVDLGADVPIDSWVAAASRTSNLLAIGLCATAPANDGNLRRTLRNLRAATDVPLFVGGRAVSSTEQAHAMGATAYTASFDDAYDLLAQLDR
jgi:hypothetical protein